MNLEVLFKIDIKYNRIEQRCNNSLYGKNILLFDDLYRSGETLKAVCNIVANQGGANNVYVLTITKTRSKR